MFPCMALPHGLGIPPAKPGATKQASDFAGIVLISLPRVIPVILAWLHFDREQTIGRVKRESRVEVKKVMSGLAEEAVVDARGIRGMKDDTHVVRGGDLGQQRARVDRRITHAGVGEPGNVSLALGRWHRAVDLGIVA